MRSGDIYKRIVINQVIMISITCVLQYAGEIKHMHGELVAGGCEVVAEHGSLTLLVKLGVQRQTLNQFTLRLDVGQETPGTGVRIIRFLVMKYLNAAVFVTNQ